MSFVMKTLLRFLQTNVSWHYNTLGVYYSMFVAYVQGHTEINQNESM